MTQPLTFRGWLRRGVPKIVAEFILVADLGMGLAWLIASPNRSRGPSNGPARTLLSDWLHLPGYPLRWLGGLLVILAVWGLVALHYRRGFQAWRAFGALLPYWVFWLAAYSAAAITNGSASIVVIGLILTAIVGHGRAALTADLLDVQPRERP